MGNFLESQAIDIKTALIKIADSTDRIEQHLAGSVHVQKEMARALLAANAGRVDRSIGEHRIGALKRISAAIDFISVQTGDVEKFEKIRRILLDIKGR